MLQHCCGRASLSLTCPHAEGSSSLSAGRNADFTLPIASLKRHDAIARSFVEGVGFSVNASAIATALFVPPALDQGDPASPDVFASSGSVVALCFAIPGGRTGCALCSDGPAPPDVVKCFANSGNRTSPSPTGFATDVPVAVALYFKS